MDIRFQVIALFLSVFFPHYHAEKHIYIERVAVELWVDGAGLGMWLMEALLKEGEDLLMAGEDIKCLTCDPLGFTPHVPSHC